MKKSFIILMIGLLVGVVSCSFTAKQKSNEDRQKLLIDLISFVLDKAHFDARVLNDAFSEEVYKTYINKLDPQKRYFYQSDIEEFSVHSKQIDDYIRNKELDFFLQTYERLQQRLGESKILYSSILDNEFDFTEKDAIDVDYENVPYVENEKQMRKRWNNRLKYSTLSTYFDKIEEQEKDLEKNPDKKAKSNSEIEKESREITKSSVGEFFDFSEDLNEKDWFAVYINSIVETYDPHTYYFAPKDKDRFDISMSGKLEGIGARLQKKNENIKIVEVISGGPAWRGEEVEVGDIILKVKQEDEEEAISIVGMRLDDAVSLIKGPKGTKVTLTLRRVDASIEDVVITRDVVELEETYAKSSLINKGDKNFGLINLPKFYFNAEDYDSRNAASDVKQEIERLKEKNINGLVIDLRNNGGGSLKTAVDVAGLFIKTGPVVQVKSRGARKQVLEDNDPTITWNGPLVIMVNELSASASEILAAAIQDYKRGIIIGSKQTYGKGTVQSIIDLNRWLRSNNNGDLGAIKVTTSKFYRINGGSTQLEGVKSDVVVPDRYSYIEIGEKDQDNPLPYDKIEAAQYKYWNSLVGYHDIIKRSKDRMNENKQIGLIDESAKWLSKRRDMKEVSLKYSDYRNDIEENEKKIEYFKKIEEYTSALEFNSLPYELSKIEQDTVLGEKRKRWHKNLKTDVYIDEAINVLEDIETEQYKANLGVMGQDKSHD